MLMIDTHCVFWVYVIWGCPAKNLLLFSTFSDSLIWVSFLHVEVQHRPMQCYEYKQALTEVILKTGFHSVSFVLCSIPMGSVFSPLTFVEGGVRVRNRTFQGEDTRIGDLWGPVGIALCAKPAPPHILARCCCKKDVNIKDRFAQDMVGAVAQERSQKTCCFNLACQHFIWIICIWNLAQTPQNNLKFQEAKDHNQKNTLRRKSWSLNVSQSEYRAVISHLFGMKRKQR